MVGFHVVYGVEEVKVVSGSEWYLMSGWMTMIR
jgi:hypothetical protein